MQKRRGFTTVELVIVIAVIAILATALIPTFGGLIDSANHNADIQTARNLSTQVMMYAMEHEINDEADLRAAIDTALGEGYYDNLEPKSARKGYCYWYDYNNCQIVLGTIEEIIAESQKKLAVPSDWDITMANGLTGNKDFAAGNMRTMVIPGYFLMAREGDNDLTKIITSLEKSLAGYCDGLVKLEQLAASFNDNTVVKPIMDAFVASVKKTPILTGSGLFLTPDATEINNVYVPFGTDELANTTVHVVTITDGQATSAQHDTTYIADKLVASFKLKLPQGTKLGANVLNLERVSSENNPFLTGSDEIHINIEEKDLGTYFFADVTDAVIVLPTGRYIQNGTDFAKLTADGQKKVEGVTAPAYGELKSFGTSFIADSAETGTTMIQQDGSTIYISADYIDSTTKKTLPITIKTNTFMGILDGVEAELPIRNAEFSVNNNLVSSNGLEYTFSGLNHGDVISVKVRDFTNTYTVKIVELVEDFAINTLGGKDPTGANGSNPVFELLYKDGEQTWDIGAHIKVTDGKTNITLDTSVTCSANDLVAIQNGKLVMVNDKLVGDHIAEVTFTCRGQSYTVEVKLVDNNDPTFEPTSKVDNFIVGDTWYVGKEWVADITKSNITLGTLFKTVAGVELDPNKAVVFKAPNSSTKELTKDNWASTPITFPADTKDGETFTYTITAGGAKATVTVKIVSGAYNVYDPTSWDAAPDKVDIAVLKPFSISTANYETTTNSRNEILIAAGDGTGRSFINIGAKTFYGNLQQITVTEGYLINAYSYNYFISTNGGTVDNAIIVGPDYGNSVSVSGQNGQDLGTHIAAVQVQGGTEDKRTTISNSFLSGFRAPISSNGGYLKIANSTLHRGNFGNMTVDGRTDILIENVNTVQYAGLGGNIGAGIFFKHSIGSSSLTVTSDSFFNQHNLATGAQIRKIAGQFLTEYGDAVQTIGPEVLIPDSKLDDMTATTHGSYYGSGIFILGMVNWEKGGSFLRPTYTELSRYEPNVTISGPTTAMNDQIQTSDTIVRPIIKKTLMVTVGGLSTASCSGTCSHANYDLTGTVTQDTCTEKTQQFINAFLNGNTLPSA